MFASSTTVSHLPEPDYSSGPHEVELDAARYTAAARLMESLLHDVRNPLNALAINAEVLGEKLKDESGMVPAAQEKNLRAIRAQVQRVDSVLRQFARFIVPPSGPGEVDLAELVERTTEVVEHECRRRQVKVRVELERELPHRVADVGALTFLVFQPLMMAIEQSGAGRVLAITLQREGSAARLMLKDEAGGALALPHRPVLEAFAQRAQVNLFIEEGKLSLFIP